MVIVSNCFLNTCLSTRRLVQLSALIGKTSFCSGWQLTLTFTNCQSGETKWLWSSRVLGHKWDIYHTHARARAHTYSHTPLIRDHLRRPSGKTVRSRGWHGLLGSPVLWVWRYWWTPDLMTPVVVVIKSVNILVWIGEGLSVPPAWQEAIVRWPFREGIASCPQGCNPCSAAPVPGDGCILICIWTAPIGLE